MLIPKNPQFMGHPVGFLPGAFFFLTCSEPFMGLFLFIFRGFGAEDHLLFFPNDKWVIRPLDDFHSLGHSAANCPF